MNILSVGGKYKPYNGGNAKRISMMCEEFAKINHNVIVMTVSIDKTLTKKEVINNVTILRYSTFKVLCSDVEKCAKEYMIDVILVHEEAYLRKISSLAKKYSIVYECHAIEPDTNKIKEFAKRFLRRQLFNSVCDAIFVLSNKAKKQICEQYGISSQKIFFTPNGLEKDCYKGKDYSFGEKEKFVYGYAGTLYAFQGVHILLEYCQQILSIADDVEIRIVGGGPMEQQVRNYIKENSLSKRIIFIGEVNQEEFDKQVSEFDVLLMPRPSTQSTESAIPLKIFDAAKHKKPVVMSNVSGLTEAFSEEAALIYDTQNPAEFVLCCKKIYRNYELAKCLVKGEEKALEAWPTVKMVAERQVNVMHQICEKKGVANY